MLRNLLAGGFTGTLFAVNPKPVQVPDTIHCPDISTLPPCDLAILSIPAKPCVVAIEALAARGTRAFIVFTAGFGGAGAEGKALEQRMADAVKRVNGTLIGPNCIGLINGHYNGVFTTPIPDFDPQGCELVSGSGATAVFIMEAAMATGLRFSNVWSIGNAALTGVEEVLEYLDLHFDPAHSPRIKLLYMEQIRNPFKFLKHASSLVRKGCMIAAIKAGYSDAGSRAASSHTGALATSDTVVRALFRKAGIVYCSSREELITIGCIFQSKPLPGPKMAIITHAGGSAVMLTDALTTGGMQVPPLADDQTATLRQQLHPGSSLGNPIDFLATGTAEQLGAIIDFCEAQEDIDAMIVVFGSPGLLNVRDVYRVLDEKMRACSKPIFPVLPSLINARQEIEGFLTQGHVNFPDEVVLGRALPHVYFRPEATFGLTHLADMATATIRSIISEAENGYLQPAQVRQLLQAAGIAIVKEQVCQSASELELASKDFSFPLVLKVTGPVHKTDVGGVSLNINSTALLMAEYERLMQIPGAKGVLLQEMLLGEELFAGAVRQGNFGHLVVCGLGGIFVEVMNDVAYGLAPLSHAEAHHMIQSLKGYKIIQGYRKRKGVNEELFADAVVRIASLVHLAPEIMELDINPFKADDTKVVAVDARVRIEKQTLS